MSGLMIKGQKLYLAEKKYCLTQGGRERERECIIEFRMEHVC